MHRVVLVEPDPALRRWCCLHLESQQLSVLAFDDVRSALEAARIEPPDLLMVATDMHAAGAFALAATIRSSLRTALIPILFLVPSHDAEALAHAPLDRAQGSCHQAFDPGRSAEICRLQAGECKSGIDRQGRGKDCPARERRPGGANCKRRERASAGCARCDVLVVVLRNFVSLARAMSAKPLGVLLRRFMSAAGAAIADKGAGSRGRMRQVWSRSPRRTAPNAASITANPRCPVDSPTLPAMFLFGRRASAPRHRI